jgi:bifunctional pyridoxal-dependent enzyme with beta-cystathionase and maltose regulon repressor activities
MSAVYANSSNQLAALKELYTDNSDYMQDLVYKENPFLALVPKNESP